MNKLDTLCFLREQTSFDDDYMTEFGYKVHKSEGRFYLTFPAVLQSFGVKNRNRRIYEASNIMHCIESDEQIQTMLKQNSWMGEIDHPAPDKQGEELTMQRIANPDMSRTSHYIRSPHLNGNLLEANIQTDSGTEAGMNMAIKIVDGKIVPCFSARVLGALDTTSGRPVVNVRKLITYDWVLFPSHADAQAKIMQPLQESVSQFEQYTGTRIIPFPDLARMAVKEDNVKFLCESFDISEDDVVGVTSTGNSVVFAENGNVYAMALNDTNIRNRTKSILSDWLYESTKNDKKVTGSIGHIVNLS